MEIILWEDYANMETTTLIGFAGAALGGYFAIMNPIANTPIFLSLTTGDDEATKKKLLPGKVFCLHLQLLLL